MSYVPAPGLDLPASVLARIKNTPMEDVLLAVFRQGLPGVPVYSKIPFDTPPLFVLLRRNQEYGRYNGRRGLTDAGSFSAHVYAEDPDGDEKGSLVSDALMDVAEEAFVNHWSFDGLGSINYLRCTQGPTRVTDWATSSGPVQFADLPTGDWRYETHFEIRINPPR